MLFIAENISHSFNAGKLHYYTTESVTLTCTGTIELPDFTRISIRKDNVTFNSTEQNRIEFNTNSHNIKYHQYGIYHCVMDASGMEFTKSVFLKNKGKLVYNLFFNLIWRLVLRLFNIVLE